MLSTSLSLFCRIEKNLSRLIQTLPVLDKAIVPNNAVSKTEHNDIIIQEYDKIPFEKIKDIRPKSISSFYINESEILQALFSLNVNLFEVEENEEAFKYILQRNFSDIKGHIMFLEELNIEKSDIGNIISKNPMILKEDIEDLKVRVNYLEYKKFTPSMITNIVKKNPFWLSHR